MNVEKTGRIIKELRKSENLTQEKLAKIIGVDQTSVAKYETGVNMPDVAILERLANYFNVSVDYLLGRVD